MKKILLIIFLLVPTNLHAEPFTYFGPENVARLHKLHEVARNYYESLPKQQNLIHTIDFTTVPEVTTDTNHIYANGQVVQGIFVNYFIHDKSTTNARIAQDFRIMKETGVIGISLEIAWNEIEEKDDQFVFPEYFDKAINEAKDQGLWVNILLAPHYTPDWLYEKHGDIYLYNSNGGRHYVDNYSDDVPFHASYINYSYHSPAVDDQIDFQKHAVNHYEQFPNVLFMYLGNEQIHDRFELIDYSTWAQNEWNLWLAEHKKEIIPMPRSIEDDNFQLWQEFRAQSLNTYLNNVYTEVAQSRERGILLGHRMLLYHSFSAEAPMYGYQPDQTLEADFIGNDTYSVSLHTYAFQNSFAKPMIIGETSLEGFWDEDSFYRFLMMQYYLGIDIQSVYVWDRKPYDYALVTLGGDLTAKGRGVQMAAEKIRTLSPAEDTREWSIIMLKTHSPAFQNMLDQFTEISLQFGVLPGIQWGTNQDKYPQVLLHRGFHYSIALKHIRRGALSLGRFLLSP